MVDTGATHTILPTSLLERRHIEPYERQRVSVADNRDLVC